MESFQLDLDQKFFIRFFPDHQAMCAVDVMRCLGSVFFLHFFLDVTFTTGVSKQKSEHWCNCPFNSSYTFPLRGVDNYVICQQTLKKFLRELVFLQIITLNNGNKFLNKLRIAWKARDNMVKCQV
jgi:hypothetical protein